MKIKYMVILSIVLIGCSEPNYETTSNSDAQADRVIISEAVRTLLYLPIYHGIEAGFFRQNGIEVTLNTAGSATASFAAMLSGEADISIADPMYVPISAENGSDTVVIAQIVGRIAVWIAANDPIEFSLSEVRGATISTHPRPMTAYTYAARAINDLGLQLEDINLQQIRPPNEITPLLNGTAKFAFTLEPNASIVESRGGHIVGSFPTILGDQIFTGAMITRDLLRADPDLVNRTIGAIEMSLEDLHTNRNAALATASTYFPDLPENVLNRAIERLTVEQVIPTTVVPTEASWDKAINVRVQAGDLQTSATLRSSFYEAIE